MSNRKTISFDLYAEMGFLKKPDINEKVYLTYNTLHKPVLLGILGAIAGLKGYTENNFFPEYYNQLKHVPAGIAPIGKGCENGTFEKVVTTYNNTTGFASTEEGGNLMIAEQTLIKPAFRIYLLIDTTNPTEEKLLKNLKGQSAEFIPYLGKNDYMAWWSSDSVKEYVARPFECHRDFKVETLFLKRNPLVREYKEETFSLFTSGNNNGSYMYFEKLPIGFNEELFQYDYGDFALTDWTIQKGATLKNLFELTDGPVVQLN